MENNPDYLLIAFRILGALALLIFGMKMMSEALQKMAGPQLRHILGAMTTNRLTGMLTGVFVTSTVQSSSATTVMTVSFVNAGLLTLGQAISVIMGANIGTTLTAWIISLGYNVDLTNFVFPAFFLGIMLIYQKKYRYGGDFLFGIAFMFLSLVMLSSAGKEMDLAHNESVVNIFASFDTSSYWTILAFLAIGTAITGVVQSSAAVMAITILLCSTGVLPIYLGIALVLGENIGTTMTANLAALGANIQARRAALAHLLFNVFGIIWVMCVFYPFVNLVCRMVGYDPTIGGQAAKLPIVLAMFHTCFNVSNTAILLGFIPQIEKVCCWLLPTKELPQEEEFRLQYIQGGLMKTPEISVLQAQKETALFAERMQRMFNMTRDLLHEKDGNSFTQLAERIKKYENISDNMEIEIANYLGQVSNSHLSDVTKMKIRALLREVSELESIGDACYNITRSLNRHHESAEAFTEAQTENIERMMHLADKSLTQMVATLNGKREDFTLQPSLEMETEINTLRTELKEQNIRDIDNHQYSYALGSTYMDIVSQCERLGDYVMNVVEARLN
ncbi:MAG: Na/Pi cotransporter family protein [Prevotella sp.]|nr:Na/Pi cotransporter family protein [Prevotella sp.]